MDKNSILIGLSQSSKTSFGKDAFERQSVPQKVFSAIWALECEVNNGGFSQYFRNDSRDSAGFIVEALEMIGAPRTADLCRRAVATAFPNGLPATSEAIRRLAEEFSGEVEKRLGKLDEEFFQYPHDLTALLFAYVAQRPEEFGDLPQT